MHKGDRRECSNDCGISLVGIPGKVYATCLNKRCRELTEQNQEDTHCGFRPGLSPADQFSLYCKFSRNFGSMPKTSTHALLTLRKHMTGSTGKVFGSVARVRCWRPLVSGLQVTVSLLRSLFPCRRSYITTVHRGCWTPTRACAITAPIHSLYKLDSQSKASQRWYHCYKLQDQPFAFCRRVGTACIFWTGSSTCTWSVCAAFDHAGMKISTKNSEALCLSTKPLQVSGNTLQQVKKFKYVGVVSTSDGGATGRLIHRLIKHTVLRELFRSVVTKQDLWNTAKLSILK